MNGKYTGSEPGRRRQLGFGQMPPFIYPPMVNADGEYAFAYKSEFNGASRFIFGAVEPAEVYRGLYWTRGELSANAY
jgi:hypothetical protein